MLLRCAGQQHHRSGHRPVGPDGPTLETAWTHISPQVSLNFGRAGRLELPDRRARMVAAHDGARGRAAGTGRTRTTLNYGGGARWFTKKHLAFTFDLRFYSINAQEALPGRVATSAVRVVVFTAGISLR